MTAHLPAAASTCDWPLQDANGAEMPRAAVSVVTVWAGPGRIERMLVQDDGERLGRAPGAAAVPPFLLGAYRR